MNEIFDNMKLRCITLYGDTYHPHLIKELGIKVLNSETSSEKKFWLDKYLRCKFDEK